MSARDDFLVAVDEIPEGNFPLTVKANWIAANRVLSDAQWENAAQSLRAAISLLPQPI